MNLDKFTQKAQEAVLEAQRLAGEYSHSQIEPEHLLLAAVEACFLFTLRAVAKASGVELVDVRAEAAGVLDRREGVTRFTEVLLRPTVTVRPGADRERVRRAIEKAERNCLISASLSTPVHLDSIVIEAHEPSTRQTEAA